MTRRFAVPVFAIFVGVALFAQRTAVPAECPSGETEIRPRVCRAPDRPAPSIVDYRPRSTLVAETHLVRRAKFPAIDFHGHPQGRLGSPGALAGLVSALDDLNVRVMVSADNASADRLQRAVSVVAGSPQKDRVRMLAGIAFRDVGPG